MVLGGCVFLQVRYPCREVWRERLRGSTLRNLFDMRGCQRPLTFPTCVRKEVLVGVYTLEAKARHTRELSREELVRGVEGGATTQRRR